MLSNTWDIPSESAGIRDTKKYLESLIESLIINSTVTSKINVLICKKTVSFNNYVSFASTADQTVHHSE